MKIFLLILIYTNSLKKQAPNPRPGNTYTGKDQRNSYAVQDRWVEPEEGENIKLNKDGQDKT